jgi:hypothetical protein
MKIGFSTWYDIQSVIRNIRMSNNVKFSKIKHDDVKTHVDVNLSVNIDQNFWNV